MLVVSESVAGIFESSAHIFCAASTGDSGAGAPGGGGAGMGAGRGELLPHAARIDTTISCFMQRVVSRSDGRRRGRLGGPRVARRICNELGLGRFGLVVGRRRV